jgi:hypothetical protein
MEMRSHVIAVIFDDGWKIELAGHRYGPYASKAKALATATEWVTNGRSQGHDVTLTTVLPDDGHGAPDGPAGRGRAA